MKKSIYPDKCFINKVTEPEPSSNPMYNNIKTLEELLERDEQRAKDGFKKKISLGKIVKPGKNNSFVVVPTTIEDKFYHNRNSKEDEEQSAGTSGEGEEEGDVIGEAPLKEEGEEGEGGAGNGKGGDHDSKSDAYDLGKILTEKFKLPNLKDKGKKKSATKFKYDLTDVNRGSGQILDKKRTLKQIIKTNIALERIGEGTENDFSNLLINPHDYMYRTLSRERDYESQAVVFFIRDYSGSMWGKPTELVCTQHMMIYSWLIYQFQERVDSRFILHDLSAKEVPDFNTYYNTNVAGGTRVKSSVELVNKIVEDENLAKDNNIYVFYGGDGDDWDPSTNETDKEIEKMLKFTNRMGITIVTQDNAPHIPSFPAYLEHVGLLDKHKDLMKLDVLSQNSSEDRVIEGIKTLVSED